MSGLTASSAGAPLERRGLATAVAVAAVAAATVAWGLIDHAAGVGLGAPLPPLFVHWNPAIDADALWALPLLVVLTFTALRAWRLGGTAAFLAGSFALALIARCALALAGAGSSGLDGIFGSAPEASNEYLPALPALDLGVHDFLDRFAQLAPSLPIHPSAHPPGLLLALHWLGIDDAAGMAALVIVAGALAVPLTYAIGRSAGLGEDRARIAALLLGFSPAALIYGATSADTLFATLGAAAAALLAAGGIARRVGGAVALALASFFSWALLAIGAWAVVLAWAREGLGRALRLAIVCGLGVAGFYALVYAISGYDPLGTLSAANDAYDLGIANARPYGFWVLGSPIAFLIATGLPIAWYAARALGDRAPLAIAFAAVLVASALLGFSKAETERIWLFLGPLAALAAAAVMPRERVGTVGALLLAQAVASELLLETIW